MSPSAKVRSVQVLSSLRGTLNSFGHDAQSALESAAQETRRTLEWLDERQRLWESKVRDYEQQVKKLENEERQWATEVDRSTRALAQAQAALSRCQASGSYDKEGHYHAPDCSRYSTAVSQANQALANAKQQLVKTRMLLAEARKMLANAKAKLATAQHWNQLTKQKAAEYLQQAQRLSQMLSSDLAKGSAHLGRKANDLENYLAITAPSIGGLPNTDSSPTVARSGNESALEVDYKPLENGVSGQYDKVHGKTWIDEQFRDVDPELLGPLLAHEAVHAQYNSDDPHDNATFLEYAKEEMEAYRAQWNAWDQIHEHWVGRYKSLGPAEQELVSRYQDLRSYVNDLGWEGYRRDWIKKNRTKLAGK